MKVQGLVVFAVLEAAAAVAGEVDSGALESATAAEPSAVPPVIVVELAGCSKR